VFLHNSEVPAILGFKELFSLRKICRISPRHRGLGQPAPAHGSTDFIKCLPLATRSTARIKPIESVSLLGCLDPIRRWVAIGSSLPMQATTEADGSDRGWRRLTLAAARRGRARRLTGVWLFLSFGGQFSIRFAPTGSQRRGERVYANLNRRRAAMKPDNSGVARPVLVDGEGGLQWSFSSKDVRQGFLSSLLASRLTNCNDRRRKTQIWWLPRVRRVLVLLPKIHTTCGDIYRGF
jgi:hypothetical protein